MVWCVNNIRSTALKNICQRHRAGTPGLPRTRLARSISFAADDAYSENHALYTTESVQLAEELKTRADFAVIEFKEALARMGVLEEVDDEQSVSANGTLFTRTATEGQPGVSASRRTLVNPSQVRSSRCQGNVFKAV